MPRGKDPLWEHIEQVGSKIKCKHCHLEFHAGITRIRYHLGKIIGKDINPFASVPDHVRDLALKHIDEIQTKAKKQKLSAFWTTCSSSSSNKSTTCLATQNNTSYIDVDRLQADIQKQQTLHDLTKKEERKLADKAIMQCVVANNLAFNLLRTPEFKEACAAIARCGVGYVPPNSETARTRLLEELRGDVDEYIKSIKESWSFSGCTLMADGWKDARSRPHINLLAASPKGVMFLKSVCTVGHKKDAQYICDFVSSAIEEIGPSNVVQFVSDNATNFLGAATLLEIKYPTIFTVSCAAHCINLMFQDFDKLENVHCVIENARRIVKFMYKYQHVLDLMRKHTEGRELKKPGATRFATHFLCIQSLLTVEQGLRFMVASSDWRALPQSKSEDGIDVQEIIQENDFWLAAAGLTQLMEPLMKVLRMVDGDGSTNGYIYEAMDRVKESMKYMLSGDHVQYSPFWKIIDERWAKNLHNNIHAAAGYLNPKFHYEKRVRMDAEVRRGVSKVVNKLVTDTNDIALVTQELRDYHASNPEVFDSLAIAAMQDTHPRIWWDMYGGGLKILQKVAIRILSQPCSASGCERNWSAFDAAHTKKRNRLDPKRLENLVFIRMNMHLMKTSKAKESADTKPIDLDKIDAFFGDIEDAHGDVEDEELDGEDTDADLGGDLETNDDSNDLDIDLDDEE